MRQLIGVLWMRKLLVGAALAFFAAGAAQASDYIVVASTTPSVHVGQQVDAGSRLMVEPGRSVTLMRPSGEISTLAGAPGGAAVPGAKTPADAKRMAALALLATPRATTAFGARRGGLCPAPEDLTALDAIVDASNTPGCRNVASQAFQQYLQRTGAANAASTGQGASPTP
jgi:hypothetical protein